MELVIEHVDKAVEERWHRYLMGEYPAPRSWRSVWSKLPRAPRCELCAVPFGGPFAPALRMLGTPISELAQRARNLAEELTGTAGVFSALAREDVAFVGGGSLPDQTMPTWVGIV